MLLFRYKPFITYYQLKQIKQANFTRQYLLNQEKSHLFHQLQAIIPPPFRLFAKVNLGELLACTIQTAYQGINCKRIDFLITDHDFKPLIVLEYLTSISQKKYQKHNIIKKMAVEKAGIIYLVIDQDNIQEINAIINTIIQKQQ